VSTNIGAGPEAQMSVPVVHWPRYPYVKWLVAGLMMLWIVTMWLMSRRTSTVWAGQFWILMLPQVAANFSNIRHVLSGGVFCRVRADGGVKWVPLSVAEVTRTGGGMRMRWSEGKQTQSLTVSLPVPFADTLKDVALSTHSAEPGSTPASTTEAAQAVTFGFPAAPPTGLLIMLMIPYLGLSGLAFWLNQPLFLLPLATLAFLGNWLGPRYLLMFSGAHLWLLTPDAAPHPIPLTAVREVTDGTKNAIITTHDATYPEIRLTRHQSRDLLSQLKRSVAN
jgi:hypothetical protein